MGEREVSDEEQLRFGEAMKRREEREAYLEVGGMAYAEEEEPPRAALLELSRSLRVLAEEGFGDLAAEARLAWALSLGALRTPEQQGAALRFVERVRARFSDWSSGGRARQVLADLRLTADARGDEEGLAALGRVGALLDARLQNLYERRSRLASEEAEKAHGALVALMDALRERAPEHLR